MPDLETKPLRKTTTALIAGTSRQFFAALEQLRGACIEDGEVDASWQLDIDGMRWVREKPAESIAVPVDIPNTTEGAAAQV